MEIISFENGLMKLSKGIIKLHHHFNGNIVRRCKYKCYCCDREITHWKVDQNNICKPLNKLGDTCISMVPSNGILMCSDCYQLFRLERRKEKENRPIDKTIRVEAPVIRVYNWKTISAEWVYTISKDIDNRVLIINGMQIRLHEKLRMFINSGITCVLCGLKGQFFTAQHTKDNKHILRLWAKEGNTLVEITKDHWFPKSRFGEKTPKVTMCAHCNNLKANMIPLYVRKESCYLR